MPQALLPFLQIVSQGTGGSLNVDIHLKPTTPDTYLWHYIAAPVTVSKTVFTDIEPYNLMLYDETKVTDDVVQGWQWHDGYDGTTSFNTLEARKGYQVMVDNDTTVVFRNLSSLTTSMGQIDLHSAARAGIHLCMAILSSGTHLPAE
jgi:hypothetical protein